MTPNSKRRQLAAMVVLGLSISGAHASDLPAALSCDFKTGSTGAFDQGKFTFKPATALTFQLTAINLQGQSAESMLPGSEVTSKLAVARAVGANHFLEVVTEGYWNITTIYEIDAASQSYPAVHSRHFGLLGQPVVAHYTGFCKAVP